MALVRGGEVLAHVQKCADDIAAATGAESFGTYPGHDPAENQAMDIFVPVNSRELGDKVCQFLIDNYPAYGEYYWIYRQRIYNPEIGSYWRDMARRGNPNVFDYTANHYDHVHVSFYATGDVPGEKPSNLPKGDVMSLSIRYVWGENQQSRVDWVFDGPSRVFAAVGVQGVLDACDKSGVVELGVVDDRTHGWFRDVASGWGK